MNHGPLQYHSGSVSLEFTDLRNVVNVSPMKSSDPVSEARRAALNVAKKRGPFDNRASLEDHSGSDLLSHPLG